MDCYLQILEDMDLGEIICLFVFLKQRLQSSSYSKKTNDSLDICIQYYTKSREIEVIREIYCMFLYATSNLLRIARTTRELKPRTGTRRD